MTNTTMVATGPIDDVVGWLDVFIEMGLLFCTKLNSIIDWKRALKFQHNDNIMVLANSFYLRCHCFLICGFRAIMEDNEGEGIRGRYSTALRNQSDDINVFRNLIALLSDQGIRLELHACA